MQSSNYVGKIKIMLKKLKDLFYRYFDYDIIGEFYDSDGNGHYYKRYIRKYYLRCMKKKKERWTK